MQGLPSLVKGAGLRTPWLSAFVGSNPTPCINLNNFSDNEIKMISFSKNEIQASISKIYRALEDGNLKIDQFIVIGGAALVLQDVIEETEDVDICTTLPRGPVEFSSVIQNMGYSFEFTNQGGKFPLGLRFHDNNKIPYTVGYAGIYTCLVEPCLIYKKVRVSNIDIPVRPAELIKKDYEKFLTIHKDSDKFVKIKTRYDSL